MLQTRQTSQPSVYCVQRGPDAVRELQVDEVGPMLCKEEQRHICRQGDARNRQAPNVRKGGEFENG